MLVFKHKWRVSLCLACQALLRNAEPQKVVGSAAALVDKFVRPGSEYEINVQSNMIKKLIQVRGARRGARGRPRVMS